MGVCLINDNFEELRFDYYDKEREEKEKEKKGKKYTNQKMIAIDNLYLEKIKKRKLLKKKTHDNKYLGIQKNEEILLLSSTKKDRAKTESAHLGSKPLSLRSKNYDIVNYPKDVFELINKIRNKPESFIVDVETAITHIKKYKDKLIYNGNIKIYLNKGEKMFKEAIDYLKKTKSMKPLTFNQDIKIEMPTDEEFNKDKDIFKKKILKEKKIKNIERYYREAIKDPYVGVLMMIVDDTIKNQGEKRITILNPILSNIFINCKMYGNNFLAYLTFSK